MQLIWEEGKINLNIEQKLKDKPKNNTELVKNNNNKVKQNKSGY